jgi:hypothetical protein
VVKQSELCFNKVTPDQAQGGLNGFCNKGIGIVEAESALSRWALSYNFHPHLWKGGLWIGGFLLVLDFVMTAYPLKPQKAVRRLIALDFVIAFWITIAFYTLLTSLFCMLSSL